MLYFENRQLIKITGMHEYYGIEHSEMHIAALSIHCESRYGSFLSFHVLSIAGKLMCHSRYTDADFPNMGEKH